MIEGLGLGAFFCRHSRHVQVIVPEWSRCLVRAWLVPGYGASFVAGWARSGRRLLSLDLYGMRLDATGNVRYV